MLGFVLISGVLGVCWVVWCSGIVYRYIDRLLVRWLVNGVGYGGWVCRSYRGLVECVVGRLNMKFDWFRLEKVGVVLGCLVFR